MFLTLYNTERPQIGSCAYFLFASDFAGAIRDLIALNMAFGEGLFLEQMRMQLRAHGSGR